LSRTYQALSYKKIVPLVQEIEDDLPVQEWTINGTRIWPILRFKLASRLRDFNYVGSVPASAASEPREAARRRVLPGSLRRDLGALVPGAGALLFGISRGKTRISGRYYNQYIDPLAADLNDSGIRTIVIDRDKEGLDDTVRSDSYLRLSYPRLKPVLGCLAALDLFRGMRFFLPRFDELRSRLEPYLGESQFLRKSGIARRYLQISALKRLYARILKKIRPRVAILQCFYASDSMAIAWACKELGISCFDYQHGVQGELHYAYSEWRKMPERGYELLVDGFLTWDESSSRQLRSWLHGRMPVYTIGNLWHERVRDFDADFRSELVELDRRIGGRRVVVFTAQDFLPDPWLMDAIRGTPELFWCLRLHPQHRYLREEFLSGLGDAKNFDLEHSSSVPLPFLLDRADIHVTGSSSVVKEAEQYGILSVVTDEIGLAYYREMIDAGSVKYAANARELAALCRDRLIGREMAVGDRGFPDRDIFFGMMKGT
jgi:hypothetical protein